MMSVRVCHSWVSSLVLVVASIVAPDAAGAGVIGATAESNWDIVGGASWEFNTANAGWYTLTVKGKFTHRVVPPLSAQTTVGPKDKMLGASATGAFVSDPDGSGARADGTVNIFNVSAGIIRFSYGYTIEAKATGVDEHFALSKAILNDPVPLIIGNPSAQLNHTHRFKAGSQVQGRDALDPDAPPELTAFGRFGQGTFDGGAGGGPLPEIFWAEPAPTGAFELYRIVIFENMSGAIEADVTQFTSPNPDYAVSFTMTAAETKTAIESAGWALDPNGVWVLPTDVLVVDCTITATTSANDGEDGAIGIQTSQEAFGALTSVPTVSEWGLVVMALLVMVVGTVAMTRYRAVQARA